MLALVLASGAGLLVLGATGLISALADAEVRAVRDANRAAEATAQDLRRALNDPSAFDLTEPMERFGIRDGEVVVPEETLALPDLGQPLDLLPLHLRSSLESIGSDEGALSRVLAAVLTLEDPLRAWVEVRVAWNAHRRHDPQTRDKVLDVLADRTDQTLASGSTVSGALLLLVTVERPVPDWILQRMPRVDAELAVGTFARLRELGASDLANGLEEQHTRITNIRTAVALGQRALSLHPAGVGALPMEELLLLLSGDGSQGAVVPPVPFITKLQASKALVVPWSGTLRTGRPVDTVPVIDGVVAIEPDAPQVDRTGLIGISLMLAACGTIFVFGLVATRRALRREGDALKVRQEFLTSVTHELKTPVASMRLLAERLHAGKVSENGKQQEYFGLLTSESARLSVLIENVLDLGRMERGERSYDRSLQLLDEVVGEAVVLVTPLAAREGITIGSRLQSGATGIVDRSALVQLVVNVLDNARKYAGSGDRIEVHTCTVDGAFELLIRDFGAGVPEHERTIIFEPFLRGSLHRNGGAAGVGIGLHLGREIARAHDGELDCLAPTDGVGALFRLRLPIVADPVPDVSGGQR